jgi:hypothetical protein
MATDRAVGARGEHEASFYKKGWTGAGRGLALKARRCFSQWLKGSRGSAVGPRRRAPRGCRASGLCATQGMSRLLLAVPRLRSGHQGLKPSCQVRAVALVVRRRQHGSAGNTWHARACDGGFLPGECGIWGHAWVPH